MNLTTLVFLGLAVVWAVVLLPEVLSKLSGVRRSDSIRSFNNQLSVLDGRGQRASARSNVIDLRGRSAGAAPAARRSAPSLAGPRPVPMAVRKRRQDVITALVAAAVLTLLCTVAFGGAFFLVLHLLADVLLVAYVVALQQVTRAAPAPAPRRVARPLAGDPSADLRAAPIQSHEPARRIAN